MVKVKRKNKSAPQKLDLFLMAGIASFILLVFSWQFPFTGLELIGIIFAFTLGLLYYLVSKWRGIKISILTSLSIAGISSLLPVGSLILNSQLPLFPWRGIILLLLAFALIPVSITLLKHKTKCSLADAQSISFISLFIALLVNFFVLMILFSG